MSVRGRVINRFTCVLAQLDTQSTTVNATRQEPGLSYDPITGARVKGRAEREIQVTCQVETGSFEALQMIATGNAPLSSMTLVMHYEDLIDAGLMGEDNRPLVNVNDRLVRLLSYETGETEADFGRSPLYITEATPSGFGFGGRVNLLVCRLGDRAQGKRE